MILVLSGQVSNGEGEKCDDKIWTDNLKIDSNVEWENLGFDEDEHQ